MRALTKHCKDGKAKEDEASGAKGVHGRCEKCVQISVSNEGKT
jgi:hypothetical protein